MFPHVAFSRYPGHGAQSVARLTQEPEVLSSIPGPAAYFRFSFPVIQGQLSVTGEGMCTMYWLTAEEVQACPGKV